jgi:asparagine synthase (glutamine-hydrolysing)
MGTISTEKESAPYRMAAALASRGGTSRHFQPSERIWMGVRGPGNYIQKAVFQHPKIPEIFGVAEGEIYNGEEILDRLENENVRPTDIWDSFFALPLLYERMGRDFPRILNGVFSIALWDGRNRTLHLIRDHLGSRSLFWAKSPDGLVFASTVRALLTTGRVEVSISMKGLAAYLSSVAVSPPQTLFKGVQAVRPGYAVVWNEKEISEYSYWPINQVHENYKRTEGSFAEEIRETLKDAVRIRKNGNFPIGGLVSGGLDTGVVTSLLAEDFSRDCPLPVFSIAFSEQSFSEADLQQVMYDRFPLAPHAAELEPYEFWDLLAKAVEQLDVPVNDPALVGMLRVFGLAREHGCRAVFDGEAADELFFTGHAHSERAFQRLLFLPLSLRQGFLGRLIPHMPLGTEFSQRLKRLFFRLGLPDNERRLLVLPSFYRHAESILADSRWMREDPLWVERAYLGETSLSDPLNIYHYGLLKGFLPNDLLYKNERMASCCQVVNRTPFIDPRLVELAFKIPARLKIQPPSSRNDGTKRVYKRAVRDWVPSQIFYRKKSQGFSHPISLWFQGPLREVLQEALLSPEARCRDFLNRAYYQSLVDAYFAGRTDLEYLVTGLLFLEFWLRHWDGQPKIG